MKHIDLFFRRLLSVGAIVVIAFGVAACGESNDQRASARAGQPAASSIAPAPRQSGDAGEPAASSIASAPSQSPAPDRRSNTGQTAKASDDPLKRMDKEEESQSMPRPGQANDHSTLAPKGSKQ
jgi:hypothetical protein